MNSFDHVLLLIFAVAIATAFCCFLVALIDIVVHREQRRPQSPAEMRRYMLCGFYCNPEDPRPVVHRPAGRGYTINLRREQLVVVALVMSMLAVIAGVIIALAPK